MNYSALYQLAKEYGPAIKDTYDAVGQALDADAQKFVIARGAELAAFLRTPEGKDAAQLFVQMWQDAVKGQG